MPVDSIMVKRVMKEDRKEVSMVTHLQFGDAGGQNHGEEGDEGGQEGGQHGDPPAVR